MLNMLQVFWVLTPPQKKQKNNKQKQNDKNPKMLKKREILKC